jgi:hypothetical protein
MRMKYKRNQTFFIDQLKQRTLEKRHLGRVLDRELYPRFLVAKYHSLSFNILLLIHSMYINIFFYYTLIHFRLEMAIFLILDSK